MKSDNIELRLENNHNTSAGKKKPALFLVGAPGVGKTTVIKKTIELGECLFEGFYTQELRQNKQRYGFEIITLDGQQALLATKDMKIGFLREFQFGEYKVNIDAIDKVAVPSLLKTVAENVVLVIDEIGPMEMLSDVFCSAVLEVLDNTDIIVMGTIVQRRYDFTDSVKNHPRVLLQEVSMENRADLPYRIGKILAKNI